MCLIYFREKKILVQRTLFLTISISIFLNRFAGPHDHLCCWYRYALSVLGSSFFTWKYIFGLVSCFLVHLLINSSSYATPRTMQTNAMVVTWMYRNCCGFTMRSPRNTNFHPLRLARTAKSMSSTVVLSFQPPASFRADMRHTPAVPVHRHSEW